MSTLSYFITPPCFSYVSMEHEKIGSDTGGDKVAQLSNLSRTVGAGVFLTRKTNLGESAVSAL